MAFYWLRVLHRRAQWQDSALSTDNRHSSHGMITFTHEHPRTFSFDTHSSFLPQSMDSTSLALLDILFWYGHRTLLFVVDTVFGHLLCLGHLTLLSD